MSISNPKYPDIDSYISTFPEDVREILQKIREIVREVIPEMNELIRYDMPSFDLNHEYILHLAAWKKHIALYGISLEAFEKELAPYLKEKGTIQFQLNQPIPYALIKRLILAKRKEIEAKIN